MRAVIARALALLVGAAVGAACAAAPGAPSAPTRSLAATAATPTASPAVAPSAPARPSATPSGSLPMLEEGELAAGRYRLMAGLHGWVDCDGAAADVKARHCDGGGPPAQYLHVEITVPAGWQAMAEGTVIAPSGVRTGDDPDGAAIVIGWTDPWAGLHADPCLPVAHRTPDIPVGPTVEDFTDALLAHPGLDVSDPVDTELGGYRGSFLTLTGPSDIGGCDNWRPWEPGIYAQGPDNRWNLWVIDVDGFRMIVLTEDFAGTPPETQAELRAIVESIRFVPRG